MGMRHVGSKGTLLPQDALFVGILFAPFTCGLSLVAAALFCAWDEHTTQTSYTNVHKRPH